MVASDDDLPGGLRTAGQVAFELAKFAGGVVSGWFVVTSAFIAAGVIGFVGAMVVSVAATGQLVARRRWATLEQWLNVLVG